MASLLRVAGKRGIAPSSVRRLLAAVNRSEGTPVRQRLIEPLSERELDVLRLLGSDLDGPDIARELTVSLNTMRTHIIVGVGNGLILGWLMYRSGLVPRGLALLGLIAGPILCAAGIATLFGVIGPDSAPKTLAAAPEFVWELSLGIYLMVKGFRPSPIITEATPDTTRPTPRELAV